MNSRNFSILVLIYVYIFREAVAVNKNVAIGRGFLFPRPISIAQRSCNCPMPFSCSCCQSVIILYTKKEKNLCVNFTYQRNGLNVDVALSSDIINTRTIGDYKAFQYCTFVPGCYFSTACVNIRELNKFSKSLTVCLRLDIYAKKQLWQINYDCISVSTELPMAPKNGTIDVRGGVTAQTGNGGSSVSESTMEVTALTEIITTEMSKTSAGEAAGMTEKMAEMTEMSVLSQGMDKMTID